MMIYAAAGPAEAAAVQKIAIITAAGAAPNQSSIHQVLPLGLQNPDSRIVNKRDR